MRYNTIGVSRPSQVVSAREMIEKEIQQLSNKLDELDNRLSIVLADSKVAKDKPKPERPLDLVPLAASLQGLAKVMNEYNSRLSSIIERIEL